MKLTIEQERVFNDWVRRKVEHPSCHLCQSSHWHVGELISCGERDPGYRSASAMVQLVCDNCGHVLLFDAQGIKAWNSVDTTANELM